MFTITASKNMKRRLGESACALPATKVRRIMSSLPDRMKQQPQTFQEMRPDATLQTILGKTVNMPSYTEVGDDFFSAPTQAEIDAYQHDILAAVRASKVDTLREFYNAGRPMKCSNEFGESILHLACRKGLTDVAKFLVEEAKVPVQVCDDYGRNPLHDAVWVHKPNFELVDLILKLCPDLLYIKDRRGHTPLGFARRDQWKLWNDYLKSKTPEFLTPRTLKLQTTALSTNTTPSAALVAAAQQQQRAAVPAVKRPSVAASGIKIPTFLPQVAARGIKIPTAAPFPSKPPGVAASGINVLLQAASSKVGPPNPQQGLPNPKHPAATAG